MQQVVLPRAELPGKARLSSCARDHHHHQAQLSQPQRPCCRCAAAAAASVAETPQPSIAAQRAEEGPASSSGRGSEPTVLLVDHGSRKASSNQMLEAFAKLYRCARAQAAGCSTSRASAELCSLARSDVSRRQKVAVAHMELAEPSIADAIARLARQGETDVVLVPYFLSPGRHITQDIPALVAAALEANPSVHCRIADPIGAPRHSPALCRRSSAADTPAACRLAPVDGKHHGGACAAGDACQVRLTQVCQRPGSCREMD